MITYRDSLHKRVGDRHSGDDHDVHKQRENDDFLVEAHERVVLGKTVLDEVRLDSPQEVPVKNSVYQEVKSLFNTVPVLISDNVPVMALDSLFRY